jgi:hypothetical protein
MYDVLGGVAVGVLAFDHDQAGADARLYVHVDLLAADGAWGQRGDVEFSPLRSLTDEDLCAVLPAVHRDLGAAGPADKASVALALARTVAASDPARARQLLRRAIDDYAATVGGMPRS